MKRLYWRPQRVSLRLLSLLALVAVGGLVLVELVTVHEKQPYYAEKIKASRIALRAFEVIKEQRLKLGQPLSPEVDPAGTGMIGKLLTPVTTNPGHLPAKQTSVNPNFAAVMVELLSRAGVTQGSVVAIGFSGSFPALNICTMAAMKVLGAEPIIISSAGASQWGANIQELMWLDMERILKDNGIFPYRSIAASRGGIDDRALGLPPESRKLLDDVIDRNNLARIAVKDSDESVEARMMLFREHAGNRDITAYVNVGGGTASVGTSVGKKLFRPGLNRTPPRGSAEIDSIMTRMAVEGIPVINITNIQYLAERYGLPLEPVMMPTVGQGTIFFKEVHSRLLASTIIVVIVLLLIAFIRFDWGYRLIQGTRREQKSAKPEQMV